MAYKLNGKYLSTGVAFRDSEGTQYPANWLNFSTEEQRAAVPTGGITWIADPPWYDQRFYWGVDKPRSLTDIPTYDSYDSEGKGVGSATGSQAGLKSEWIQKQKDFANQFLSKTDWLIVRKAEAGTAVPSDTTTYRAAVRTVSKEREDQITACSDTDALAKLINAGEEREKFDTSKEVKDDSGNSYDPKRYESFDPKQYEQNPDGLKKWPTA